MEAFIELVIETFGLDAAIGIAIISGFSFVASVLDAIWKDEDQPEVVSHIIKALSFNVGRASNDPSRNE